MKKLFISHSSKDDAFVRDLRSALADQGQEGWIDSRELGGGDALWTEIVKGIDASSAYAVVVSTDSLQSKWVAKELQYALKVREERGKDKFPVITLSLNGTKLGAFEIFFDEEPIFIAVRSEAGGVEAVMNDLLVALGERAAADIQATVQPKAEPLEELVLELTDLKFREQDGESRATARARLVYQPASESQRDVASEQSWRFIAPISAVETDELRWYLEKYAIWPSHHFRNRAKKVEEKLVKWGQRLHKNALPPEHTGNVMNAWARIADDADRRLSIYVDTALEAGTPEDEVKTANEAATLLLALPWELLHDGEGYLFQGAKPMRVRRRLPNTKVLDVPVVATPIRILVVTTRPEDEYCSYLDHRASALPIVEAMESLPGLVKIHILSPPTFPALGAELDRARGENKPYHVVHFDGHGTFDYEVGMGGLCFENPEDTPKLENRRHVTVFAKDLGPLLRNHRIPLVLLDACQTAQAGPASESVASELLKAGVASVVAMSHNVLVETTGRFVQAFYETLAHGERVGDAMLAGQRALKDNSFRGSIFGGGELRLEDWFVPVLYQEKDDPQLFKTLPTKQTQEDYRTALDARLGDLPPKPETGFIGRSRDLLALQRLLRKERYAVVRGQSGEGTTALAAEFARWMVRSHQVRRAVFVSVETHGNQRAVVEAFGKQLVQKTFSVGDDLEEALDQLERVLREQSTLLVIDNMESVLPPPFMQKQTPEEISEAREELKSILALCERLLKAGDTRIIFSSREALPAPFHAEQHRRELNRLDPEDAVKLVESALNADGGGAGSLSNAARDEIEELVEAIHCHARTVALLTPSLRANGVEATRRSLVELMAEMEKNFPGSREKSVFAGVQLSLARMSEANRNRARVLAVFHGEVDPPVLRNLTQWEEADVKSLELELLETGLAKRISYDHLTLNPALSPYLRAGMEAAELDSLTTTWVATMCEFVEFLAEEQTRDTQLAATLTMMELPNLFALLELVQSRGDAEATLKLANSLFALLRNANKPRLMERVCQVRDAAAASLEDKWNHLQFDAARTRIDAQVDAGRFHEALDAAKKLHERAMTAGDQAYPDADYDMAMACWQLGCVLNTTGDAEEGLTLLQEARQRFEAIGESAASMVSASISESGSCLFSLGRLDEAVAAYEDGIARDEKLGDVRGVAVGKGQIASIRSDQGLYEEALEAHHEALERFMQLNEQSQVAISWHQAGIAYQDSGDPEAAEDAYQRALEIETQRGDVAGQAMTLNQLGTLYSEVDGRLEEAVLFFQQAVEMSVQTNDTSKEGLYRNNLADVLRQLERYDEARREIRRAIECTAEFGDSSHPWNLWANLANIEMDAGNSSAGADANKQAIACYLSYRRGGGENNYLEGDISRSVTESLLAGDDAAAASFLKEKAADPEIMETSGTFIHALQSIVAGSRDRTLADAPDLDYTTAADILLLIEKLEKKSSNHLDSA